jgi:hypothetical protein
MVIMRSISYYYAITTHSSGYVYNHKTCTKINVSEAQKYHKQSIQQLALQLQFSQLIRRLNLSNCSCP